MDEKSTEIVMGELARAIAFSAHEHGEIRWDLPQPPESAEIEPADIDVSRLCSNARISGVINSDSKPQIEVVSQYTARLPYKATKGDRWNPPAVERRKHEVYAFYVGWLEDAAILAEGSVEA